MELLWPLVLEFLLVYFIHETMGINLGTGEDMTPENIAANWDKVSDMDDARPLQNGGEQTLKIFELINKG